MIGLLLIALFSVSIALSVAAIRGADRQMREDLVVIIHRYFRRDEFTAVELAELLGVGRTVPYVTLRRLVRDGVLTERQVDGPWNAGRGGRPRTYYRLRQTSV